METIKNPYPDRARAEELLKEAEQCNPGPWGDHSRIAAMCAEKIARQTGLDPEKAYVLALLHDIGRKYGVRHLGHVYDGYHYMNSLGYDAVARICLTHSFSIPRLESYIGRFDIAPEEQAELAALLGQCIYDDYDYLTQLCDCLAGARCVMDMAARMDDVQARYGYYPQEKRDANMALKAYFEAKAEMDIYAIIGAPECAFSCFSPANMV